MTVSPAALCLAIFVLRILSPALVFLFTLSLFAARTPSPSSPSSITSVVVATRVPRRAPILSLLSLCALTFLLDGLTFVVYAVLDKRWPQNSGIEINSVIGLAAFAGLAALGTWKDVNGVDVWSFKRVKAAVVSTLALDIVLVVLLGISIQTSRRCMPLQLGEKSPPFLPLSPCCSATATCPRKSLRLTYAHAAPSGIRYFPCPSLASTASCPPLTSRRVCPCSIR